jgi:hypothetical protein
MIGMFTDLFQRTVTDVGAIGPDRVRGGLYLLLPPGYEGHVPDGYFALESSTYNVFLFFRTVMAKGEGGPDPAPAAAMAEQTRVYALWAEEKDIPPMEFPNASGQRVSMMYPVDDTYWSKLKEFVDYEPVTANRPGAARRARLDRHRQGRAVGADRTRAGALAARSRDRTQDDPRPAPARASRRPQPLLRRPAVGTRLGRRHGRVDAGELSGREPARGLLPVRLLLRAGDVMRTTGAGSNIPSPRATPTAPS